MAAAALILATALLTAPPAAAVDSVGPVKVERVVVLMRHGVRPPTRALPAPVGAAQEPWPTWSVSWGRLTPHGASAVRLLAEAQRRTFRAQGVLPARSCPAPGSVDISADSDERTIRTAEVFAESLAPGCGLAVAHKPEGEPDPVFSAIASGAVAFDPAAADAAIRARRPSLVERADEARPLLGRLQAILAPACSAPACRLGDAPTALAPPRPNTRPKMEGGLDVGSTVAQVLLLEYAEGKPMRDVGWGRATAEDIGRLSALHALDFDVLAREPYVARRNSALLAERVAAALAGDGPSRARLTVIVGHDTDVASLAGVLDAHWTVAGYATDDPAPGGGLVFERVADARGRRFVRAFYVAQALEDLRTLSASPPARAALLVPACPTPCALDGFLRVLKPATDLVPPRR